MRNKRPPKGSVRRVQHIDGNSRFAYRNKVGDLIEDESFQELVFDIMTDRRPEAKRSFGQPEKIPFINRKSARDSYIPDRWIEVEGGPNELVEITRSDRRNGERAIERERVGDECARARGDIFIVVTEEDLPSPLKTANLLLMHGYSAPIYNRKTIVSQVQKLLAERSPLPFRYMISAIAEELGYEPGLICTSILYMLWHQLIETDLEKLLLIDCEPPRDVMLWLKTEA